MNRPSFLEADVGLHQKRGRGENDQYIMNKRFITNSLDKLNICGPAQSDLLDDNTESDLCGDESPHSPLSTENVPSSGGATINELEPSALYFALKGGKQQFVRKADFLEDELLRKIHRQNRDKYVGKDAYDSYIPASAGPSPHYDRQITNLWQVIPASQTEQKLLKDVPNSKANLLVGQDINYSRRVDKTNCHDGNNASQLDQVLPLADGCNPHHAGVITHSDWEMEEVPQKSNISGTPSRIIPPVLTSSYYDLMAPVSGDAIKNTATSPLATSSAKITQMNNELPHRTVAPTITNISPSLSSSTLMSLEEEYGDRMVEESAKEMNIPEAPQIIGYNISGPGNQNNLSQHSASFSYGNARHTALKG